MTSGGMTAKEQRLREQLKSESEKRIDWDAPIKANQLARAIWRGCTFMASCIEKTMRGEKV